MQRTVKWGVLSTANIAKEAVIPAIRRAHNADVIAIASASGRAKEAAAQLHIQRAYDSYEHLLQDPDIDAVYIPLPNTMHAEWTIEAARRKKHVLCEKPAALQAADVEKMREACKEHNVLFMEAFMYQFHPQHERVREIIASGEIGEVKMMRAGFSFYLQDVEGNIRTNAALGGGSLFDIGCYCIHSARYVLQTEPVEVSVQAKHHAVDMSAYGWMNMQNGVHVVWDCSFEMEFRNTYEIVGTKGMIEVPRAYRPDIHDGEGRIIVKSGDTMREELISADQYKLEVEHISECILENSEPRYTIAETIQTMKVIDACYDSIKSGRPVTLG